MITHVPLQAADRFLHRVMVSLQAMSTQAEMMLGTKACMIGMCCLAMHVLSCRIFPGMQRTRRSAVFLVAAALTPAHDAVSQDGNLAVNAPGNGLGFLMREGQVLHHFLCNLGRSVLHQIKLEANRLDLPCIDQSPTTYFIKIGNCKGI